MKKIIPLYIDDNYLTAIVDGSNLLLIDCGYPKSMSKIEYELNKHGSTLDNLVQIIITHHDYDHIGGLNEIVEHYPNVIVSSSEEQIPYILGNKKSLRLIEAEESAKTLSDKDKEENLEFQRSISSLRFPKDATAVKIGEIIPIYDGIEIVDTTGHQPGHISVYIPKEKTLIAGDALVLMDGGIRANPLYTMDMTSAVQSAKRLLNYDIQKVICYHGGIFEGDVKSALNEMIRVQG